MTPRTDPDDELWWDEVPEAALEEPEPDWDDLEGPEPVEDLRPGEEAEDDDAPAPFDQELWERLPEYD